jgi:circadian clock protein KaiC
MAHSNQIREFIMTPEGIRLIQAYLGPSGVLTGSARLAQESREKSQASDVMLNVDRKRREIGRKRQKLEIEIAALRLEIEAQEEELRGMNQHEEDRQETIAVDLADMARLRHAEPASAEYQGDNNGSSPQKAGRNKAAKAQRGR